MSFERVLSGIVSAAAITVAAGVVHREFFMRAERGAVQRPSSYVKNWQRIIPSGRTTGAANAPIHIVEFADLECPFCARFNEALHTVNERFPHQIAYTFVHYPIPGHRFALTAARAAECAAADDRFIPMVDALYAQQDSFGLKAWVNYAHKAGISDTAKFSACMSATGAISLVTAGLASGRTEDIVATPTIVLNGWRYGNTPSDTELVRAIGDLLAGRKPYPNFPSPSRRLASWLP